jgi:hypothetical protein
MLGVRGVSVLADAAAVYAEMGWPIFPLRARSKVPATAHGFKNATSDVDRVRRWWARHPDSNIAVQTGVLFDVIDVDGDTGFRTLAKTVAAHGALDTGAIVCTPGKVVDGAHVGAGAHYYVAVTGLGYTSFGANLEMKAAGGYVVLPPSIHPDGTGAYEWVQAPDPAVPYPPAPDWVHAPAREKAAARAAELAAREERRRQRSHNADSIMERFNAGATWRELLEPEGWTYSHHHGGNEYWIRPGKTGGHSASINEDGDGALYVFSSEAAPFEPGQAYSKFAALAILRFGGDFSLTARTLAAWWNREGVA